MNIQKHIALFLFLCIYPFLTGYTQEHSSVEGFLVSVSSQKPVANATIVTYRIKATDSIISTYSQSNSEGYFKLEVHPEDTLLRVNRLGFSELYLPLIKNGEVQIIQLVPEEVSLQEVVIRTERPIKIKSDTTSYKLSKFKNGSERNIEEVLKKLPGIEVLENGSITFNGKAISKILIDGDNFFSKDYQILSKNIRPDIIDNVEAIENYNDNKLFRGIKKSDKVVLNLNFNEDLKTSFFGNISAGGGFSERYSGNHNIFSLSNKIKIGYIGNINNISNNAIGQTRETFGQDQEALDQNLPYFLGTSLNLPIQLDDTYIPNIKEERYIDSQSILQALQLNYTISNNTNLNTYGYFYKKKFDNIFQNSTSILGNEEIIDFNEFYRTSSRNITGYGRSTLSVDIDSTSLIIANAELSSRNPEGIQNLDITNSNSPNESIFSENNDTYFSQKYDLNYTKKLKKNTLIQFVSSYSFDNISQDLVLNGERFSQQFGANNIQQSVQLDRNIFSISGNFISNKGKHNFEGGINYSYKNSDFFSNNINTTSVEGNDFNFSQHNYRVTGKHTFSASRKLTLQPKISITQSMFETESSERSRFLIDPSFQILYNNLKGQRLRLQTGIRTNVSSITDLYENPIITNYRAIQFRVNEINISRDYFAIGRYSYFDRKTFSKFIIGGQYDLISNPYAYNFDVNTQFSNISIIPTDRNNNTYGIYTDFNKLFHQIKNRIGVRFKYNRNEIQRIFDNADLISQKTDTYSYGTYLYSAFKGPVNFKTEINFTKVLVKENSIAEQFENDNIASKITAIIRPNKSINATLSYEYIQWPSLNSNFIDFTMNYTPKKLPQLSTSLVFRNILNTDQLAFDNISNTIIQNNTFTIVPRILFLELTWNIGTSNTNKL